MTGQERPAGADLVIEFCGEVWDLSDCVGATFGRRGDISIDDNPYLHRVLGRFEHRDGQWWIENVGTSIVISMHDADTGAMATLPPGTELAINYAEFRVRFEAGRTAYELAGSQPQIAASAPPTLPEATLTIDHRSVSLNDEQRRLLAALCRARLADPTDTSPLPSNQQLANGLGWKLSKFNRKLDYLCAKFTKLGMQGLYGGDLRANDRRRRLADFALVAKLITVSDLDRLGNTLDPLDPPDEPARD